MMSLDLIPRSFIDLKKNCEACVQAKQPRKPFQNSIQKETCLLEIIHSDIYVSNGITQVVTPPHAPLSYDIVERKHRTMLDMINAMLFILHVIFLTFPIQL